MFAIPLFKTVQQSARPQRKYGRGAYDDRELGAALFRVGRQETNRTAEGIGLLVGLARSDIGFQLSSTCVSDVLCVRKMVKLRAALFFFEMQVTDGNRKGPSAGVTDGTHLYRLAHSRQRDPVIGPFASHL
jgi:hypothetical protein